MSKGTWHALWKPLFLCLSFVKAKVSIVSEPTFAKQFGFLRLHIANVPSKNKRRLFRHSDTWLFSHQVCVCVLFFYCHHFGWQRPCKHYKIVLYCWATDVRRICRKKVEEKKNFLSGSDCITVSEKQFVPHLQFERSLRCSRIVRLPFRDCPKHSIPTHWANN